MLARNNVKFVRNSDDLICIVIVLWIHKVVVKKVDCFNRHLKNIN